MCLSIATICYICLLRVKMEATPRIMIGWDIFSLCEIVVGLAIFMAVCPKQLRVLASREDASRAVVFAVVLTAIIGSLAGVLLLLRNQSGWVLSKGLETFIYIAGV